MAATPESMQDMNGIAEVFSSGRLLILGKENIPVTNCLLCCMTLCISIHRGLYRGSP